MLVISWTCYIILTYLGHSQLVVRCLVSELVGWLWWTKWIRKRDQHPPWWGRCLNSQFNWRRFTFQFPGWYFKFFWYHRLPPPKKCQFSTKVCWCALPKCHRISCRVTTHQLPRSNDISSHSPKPLQVKGIQKWSNMIIQKFQHLQEESSTDYSLPKADQEDVVRSVKFQSVASQVGTKDFWNIKHTSSKNGWFKH